MANADDTVAIDIVPNFVQKALDDFGKNLGKTLEAVLTKVLGAVGDMTEFEDALEDVTEKGVRKGLEKAVGKGFEDKLLASTKGTEKVFNKAATSFGERLMGFSIPGALKGMAGRAASFGTHGESQAGKGATTAFTALNLGGGATVGLAGAATGFVGALTAATTAINVVMDAVSSFSPATVELMSDAFKDMQGVVGAALLPVLDKLYPVVQQMGDIFATFLGPASAIVSLFMDALMPAIQAVVAVVQALLLGFQPLIGFISGVLIVAFKILAESVRLVAIALLQMFEWISEFVPDEVLNTQAIRKAREDLERRNFTKLPGTAQGMSTKQAQYSRFEDIGQRIRLAAFQTPGANPQEETAENTRQMAMEVRDIKTMVQQAKAIQNGTAMTGNQGS